MYIYDTINALLSLTSIIFMALLLALALLLVCLLELTLIPLRLLLFWFRLFSTLTTRVARPTTKVRKWKALTPPKRPFLQKRPL